MKTKKKGGRPKGSLQKKRNEDKYWLPEGVTLSPDNPVLYNKETYLLFVDKEHGEFQSTFKNLQHSGFSVHPVAIKIRKEKTNLERYGCVNPGANPDIVKKRQDTMERLYGVRNILESEEYMEKVRETNMKNYGVNYILSSDVVKKRIAETNMVRYGIDNPAKLEEFTQKAKKTSLERYGHDNPSKSPVIKERILKSFESRGYRSGGEQEIGEYVQSLGLDVKIGGYFGGADPMQADIKIPSLKVAIEYNGEYWHTEKRVGKNYHLRKFNAAKTNGYKLLQFFEYEWINRNFQVKSFIRSALGKNSRMVNGRDTEVRVVSKQEAKEFLNNYHILGSPHTFKNAYGLYYNNELLALATMNKHHRNNKEDILTRFCGKYDVTVRGGLDKLCRAIKRDYSEFFTFIDLRMSNGQGWLLNGWSLVHQNKPDYFYFNKKTRRITKKQSMTKRNTKRPDGITESQDAETQGHLKVFDCGKLKLKYTGIKSK